MFSLKTIHGTFCHLSGILYSSERFRPMWTSCYFSFIFIHFSVITYVTCTTHLFFLLIHPVLISLSVCPYVCVCVLSLFQSRKQTVLSENNFVYVPGPITVENWQKCQVIMLRKILSISVDVQTFIQILRFSLKIFSGNNFWSVNKVSNSLKSQRKLPIKIPKTHPWYTCVLKLWIKSIKNYST